MQQPPPPYGGAFTPNVGVSQAPHHLYPSRNFRVRNLILDTDLRNVTFNPNLSEVSLSLPEPLRNVAALRILKVQITGSGGYVLPSMPTFTGGPTWLWLNSLSHYLMNPTIAASGAPTLFVTGNNSLLTINGLTLTQASNAYATYLSASNAWYTSASNVIANAALGITVNVNSSIYMTLNDYPNLMTATANGDVNYRPYFAWFNQATETYPPVNDNIYHDPHAYIFTPAYAKLQRINMRFFTYDHQPFTSTSTRIVLQVAAYMHTDP